MDDCLFKPMGLKALSVLLSGWQAPLAGGVVPGHDAQVCADQASITARLHELTGGDSEAIAGLIHEALHSSKQDLAELGDLLARQETAGFAALAHRIKGAALIVADPLVIRYCEMLEQACNASVVVPAHVLHCAGLLEQAQAKLVSNLLEISRVQGV